MIKNLKTIKIPYWINKKINIDFYFRISNENPKIKNLCMTIRNYKLITDIKGYENEWESIGWKHYILWKMR